MSASVDLYWLPLGAGGHSVWFNGKVFEAVAALRQRRPAYDLYHSALQITVDDERTVIEMAPAWDANGSARGAVAEGPVGVRWAGQLRMFRYEVRRWREGRIPDIDEAVESPQRLSSDAGTARRVLDLVARVPTMTWGRDELATGDMWNSNLVVSWLLVGAGIDPSAPHLPAGGRAPAWDAGISVARLSRRRSDVIGVFPNGAALIRLPARCCSNRATGGSSCAANSPKDGLSVVAQTEPGHPHNEICRMRGFPDVPGGGRARGSRQPPRQVIDGHGARQQQGGHAWPATSHTRDALGYHT